MNESLAIIWYKWFWVIKENIMKWLSIGWYKFLFSKRSSTNVLWFVVIWCRINNHSCGPIWYNPYGLEPDMKCKICGDYLG